MRAHCVKRWLPYYTCVCVENLTPAEQKKLRNKQRKKAKQEATKREKQKQEEQQKLQQQQQQQQAGKTRSQDTELDGPKEEELVPEKLERVSTPVTHLWDCNWHVAVDCGRQKLTAACSYMTLLKVIAQKWQVKMAE